MNLKEILLKRAEKGQLAHFYIVDGLDALDFTHAFIRDYYQKIENHKQSLSNLMDHPDVYVLGNLPQTEKPSDAFFTVAEAEAFARFFEFKSVQSKRKFAIITEGDRINTIVANKWLKLLEEPTGVTTIFLLNPREQKLLDTIHSRAIHLRLPRLPENTDLTEWTQFMSEVKNLSLSQFLENFSRGESLEFWTSELLRWESQQNETQAPKAALQNWIKTFQEMDTFNQPHATKWTLFYSYLSEHVIPRIR